MIAVGWAEFDESRAWNELHASMSQQWDSGMVPHIDFGDTEGAYFPGPETWSAPRRTTGITQPPLTAIIARRLLERSRDREQAMTSARALYPKLMAFHRWLYTTRLAGETGLLLCVHPWETGMDNSPAWDAAMTAIPTDDLPPYERKDTTHVDASERPPKIFYDRCYALLLQLQRHGYDTRAATDASSFAVADVAFNALAVRASADLVWLGTQIGADTSEARTWHDLGSAGLVKLWDEQAGIFFSFDWRAQQRIDVPTSSGFLPLLTDVTSHAQVERLAATLENWSSSVRYLVPSTDPAHSSFDAKRYWRGPVWANVNWAIAEGFSIHGRGDIAERLRTDIKEMIALSGHHEYFDPNTGDGLGAEDFSWTAALTLHWLMTE